MFTISEILAATKGTLVQGSSKARVRSVCIDSRVIKKGELFIAVKGEVFDGHDFIDEVIARGVRVIVVHKPVSISDPKISVIRIKDTVRALGDIARFHRLRFKTPVIALTGSTGKTTTKEMMAAVLSRKYKVLKNQGSQNNHIGVPLTLLKLRSYHQIVVLECGTNQPGDIIWLADVARPQVAVLTNIGESHLEKLKTIKGVLKEKWALTSFMGGHDTVVINMDDPLLSAQIHQRHPFRIITYGTKPPARWQASCVKVHASRYLRFVVEGRFSSIDLRKRHLSKTILESSIMEGKIVELNSCGINNVYNAMAAFVCGVFFKVPVGAIVRALKSFEFLQGRGQIVRLGRGWLINDTYNANPVSMRLALQTLRDIDTQGIRIFVAADMLELGSKAQALHRQVGLGLARGGIDVLITVGHLARLMAKEVQSHNKKIRVFACGDVESAQKCLVKVFHNGDAVLVKGSRRMRMEQVAEFLLSTPQGWI